MIPFNLPPPRDGVTKTAQAPGSDSKKARRGGYRPVSVGESACYTSSGHEALTDRNVTFGVSLCVREDPGDQRNCVLTSGPILDYWEHPSAGYSRSHIPDLRDLSEGDWHEKGMFLVICDRTNACSILLATANSGGQTYG